MKFTQDSRRERGAVSIFLVIFFALLIGVITISFVNIVIRDTVQSSNNDLSRTAYDSAQAGVEDAKRAIALTANECNAGGALCANYTSNLNKTDCTGLPSFVAGPFNMGDRVSGAAVKVQGSDETVLDQAYTCVNIKMNTPDYINTQPDYQSDIIPLKATSAVDGVRIQWFTHADGNIAEGDAYSLPRSCSVTAAAVSGCDLTQQGAWGDQTPSMLRVELISYDAGGTIRDDDLRDNNKTLFLYPTSGGTSTTDFDQNITPPDSASKVPLVPAQCTTDGSKQYACDMTINLGSNAGKTSFLRVTPVYKQTTFSVELTGAGSPEFDGVQPIVDSTGRANDLFRRVQARVRLQNQVVYPEFAVDTSGALCKDYAVGTDPAVFVSTNKCP